LHESTYAESVVHRLDDGTRVFVRPVRAGDKVALQRLIGGMSMESTRARFFTPKDHFTRAELTYLTELDGHDHVAFAAFDAGAPARLLGVSRYIRDPREPAAAEAAITITDELQGRGLGRLLGTILADAARAEGVTRFTASMLSDNVAAVRVFDSISARLETEPITGPVRDIVAQLAA
jgi:RimJ/RimL family protein N-acetyltransferase